MTRLHVTFLSLVVVQAAHSVEKYAGRMYEVFRPAQLVSGLISDDLRRGFVTFNLALVTFGIWYFLWPVRRGWPAAPLLAWIRVGIELVNGVGHPLWSLREGTYTPGVATAPILLLLAVYLASQLRAGGDRAGTAA